MVAARTGKVDAVNALLARGADPNVTEKVARSDSLMWAAAEGHAPVIETLVARGANVQARSNGGFTRAPVRGARRQNRRGARHC